MTADAGSNVPTETAAAISIAAIRKFLFFIRSSSPWYTSIPIYFVFSEDEYKSVSPAASRKRIAHLTEYHKSRLCDTVYHENAPANGPARFMIARIRRVSNPAGILNMWRSKYGMADSINHSGDVSALLAVCVLIILLLRMPLQGQQ